MAKDISNKSVIPNRGAPFQMESNRPKCLFFLGQLENERQEDKRYLKS